MLVEWCVKGRRGKIREMGALSIGRQAQIMPVLTSMAVQRLELAW
jgi:hypothetical protein